MKTIGLIFCVLIAAFGLVACQGNQSAQVSLDDQLWAQIQAHNITPLEPGPKADAAKVALGESLFFDKILSGNKDISCATCHHPQENMGDNLAVSIGTGGTGLGAERVLGYNRLLIPRNAPELSNRNSPEWETMFWDSRVSLNEDGSFHSPAKEKLPDGLDGVLAVQAMFPVTSRDEMRGDAEDYDVFGEENEIGRFEDTDLTGMWAALTERLLADPDYVELFTAAYPDVPTSELGFQHAANALAAFEAEAFTYLNSPWNRYVLGDSFALSDEAKQGANLFFGEAGCGRCHNGSLLTNQQHYNLAVPQVGPGKGDEAPLDLGLARETKDDQDQFKFRTPSLHNVAITGPYMHNGAYRTLEATIRHHIDPVQSLEAYDPAEHLPSLMQETFQGQAETFAAMFETVDENQVKPLAELSDQDIQHLVTFLEALTDPKVTDLAKLTPQEVASGLPVED